MGAILGVVLAVFVSQLNSKLGDAFAYIALLLMVVLLFRLTWRRFRIRSNIERSIPLVEPKTNRSVWFWPCVVLTITIVVWLYLTQMFVNKDPNPESMDNPLTVAFMEQARAMSLPINEFWQKDHLITHWKEQDPYYTWQTVPGNRFKAQWLMQAQPFENICYTPFVKWLGVGRETIICYSTFYAFLAWGGAWLLAWRMFGRWVGLLAAILMATSLGWLIHVRAGSSQVTPSVALMVALALCLYSHWQNGRRWSLVVAGCILGCMYLVGWIVIVFGVLFAGAVLLLDGKHDLNGLIKGTGIVIVAAVATAVCVAWIYAWLYKLPPLEVHQAIKEMMFGRFREGELRFLKLSTSGKMAYLAKCLFWDGQTFDGHVDKYLEGYPAVPYIFSVFFVLGLLYSFKESNAAGKFLLLWIVPVMCIIGVFHDYSHRYALVGLPAMSILAAYGISVCGDELRKTLAPFYWISLGLCLIATAWSTHGAFYGDYLNHKPPNFDDRLRGHHDFVEWMHHTGKANETLVVMSDPVMYPGAGFVFNTYTQQYRWVYWSSFFSTGTTIEQVRDWENHLPTNIHRIVYAFSPTLLGDAKRGVFFNDPRPFIVAHPDARPVWTYAYDNRPPSILVFEVKR